MTEVPSERLSSSHLEDLAFIVLSARPDAADFNPYVELNDDARARLRSRLKQLARYDFPSSLSEDKSLRRGYTLRQCCRLTVGLLLLDAHLPASLAVMLARNNEVSFLRAIASRLAADSRGDATPEDLLSVIVSGELQDTLASPAWIAAESGRVRLVRRDELSQLWADDLAGSGARLVVDMATAAGALWTWISSRRLMTDLARVALIADIDHETGPGFVFVEDGKLRR
ncbi:hypothetical protein [Sphingomonas sp. Leaf25]|uniref:hypothetical protein n=1 Tax=Sphingomonas sp. Leaf25 TaxID=1735692 RepID=UPI0006FBF0D8|nr:hypothetical protein [Sphingomonas sp. Leaf25]KQN01456.1 hypothetical protein ASE78_17415 [Sphingomonas sp. Leaf25]